MSATIPSELSTFATFHNVINGELRESNQTHRGVNSRTEEALWPVPVARSEDLDEAVQAAQDAFKSWSKTPVSYRQDLIRKLATELLRYKQPLFEVIAQETGKSKLMCNVEVEDAISFLNFNASVALEDEVAYEDQELKIVTTHTPLGVVGAICPWNFPLILATAKIAASLATGNCIIVKPSPFTPYSTLKFAEIAAGVLPPGVFQALNGGNELGAYMTLHPGIQKITFTGSTKTGKKVMESASRTLKRLTLELGGNDATIVCADIDVDVVAPQVAAGCFFNNGQMCVATKRLYVHQDIYDRFLRRMVDEVRSFPLVESPEATSIIGPLQNSMQYSIVKGIIEDCQTQGYKFATGGSLAKRQGFFIEPTVVDNPPDNSVVVREEQFGPIIPVMSWTTEDEVIRRANDTDSGLGACVWAKDIADAERIGRRLEAGSVWFNSREKPNPAGYLSGQKESGFGGELGKQGLVSYYNTQSLHIYKASASSH